jgi:molecular chaperone Hsp33
LEESWQEVQLRASPDSDACELLGQALCAAAVLGSSIKFEGTVSLQIQSSGTLRLLLGQCSSKNHVRGIARRNTDTPDDGVLLREPLLSINLEPEDSGTPYQGIVSMEGGSLVNALEFYFAQSEQIETRFWFVVRQDCCAGLMLQRMPGKSETDDDFERLGHLASTLSGDELLTLEPDHLLHLLFNEDNVRLYDSEALQFGCRCSPERVADVLQLLGQDEIHSLLAERETVDVNCEYCGKAYKFDQIDIASLFTDSSVRSESPSGVH